MAHSISNNGSVNLQMAQDFLRVLTGEDDPVVTWQTFDDDEDRKDLALARVLHGALKQHAKTLEALNKRGAGVHVAVNKTDGRGRKRENVIAVRAAVVDLDGAPLDPVNKALLQPQILNESSPGKWHGYWLMKNCPLEEFTPVQEAIAKAFDGDTSVTDLPRVFRVPGFYHRKGKPFQSRTVRIRNNPPYSLRQVIQGLQLDVGHKPLTDLRSEAGILHRLIPNDPQRLAPQLSKKEHRPPSKCWLQGAGLVRIGIEAQ